MCIILWTRCARIVGGARFDAQQLCVHRHFSVERCRPKRPHCRPWHGCSRAKPASRSRSDGDRRPAVAQASVGADRGDSSPGQDLLARTPAGPRCVPLPVGSLEPTLRLRWGRRGITIKPDGRRRPVALLPTPRFSPALPPSQHRIIARQRRPPTASARCRPAFGHQRYFGFASSPKQCTTPRLTATPQENITIRCNRMGRAIIWGFTGGDDLLSLPLPYFRHV